MGRQKLVTSTVPRAPMATSQVSVTATEQQNPSRTITGREEGGTARPSISSACYSPSLQGLTRQSTGWLAGSPRFWPFQ
jgi:hypothetical protein